MVFIYDQKSLGNFRPLFLHVLDKMDTILEWNYEPRALDAREIDEDDVKEMKKVKNRLDIMNKCGDLLEKLSEKWHRKQEGVSTVKDGEFEFYERK